MRYYWYMDVYGIILPNGLIFFRGVENTNQMILLVSDNGMMEWLDETCQVWASISSDRRGANGENAWINPGSDFVVPQLLDIMMYHGKFSSVLMEGSYVDLHIRNLKGACEVVAKVVSIWSIWSLFKRWYAILIHDDTCVQYTFQTFWLANHRKQ